MRIQKKSKLPKVSLSARGISKIRQRIERDAERFDVSMSFVICVALATFYGIHEQEPIKEKRK